MNSRPWWKLSWPAVLAGLVMLGALAVKNLDGTHWQPKESFERLPWTSVTRHSQKEGRTQWRFHRWRFGWPNKCASQRWVLRDRDGRKVVWPNLEGGGVELYSLSDLLVDLAAGGLLIAGAVHFAYRMQNLFEAKSSLMGVLGGTVSIKAMMAITAAIATNIAIFLHGDDWLWTIKPLATGMVFVGIFLTCFAVIDWIGGLWSLATRRLFARSPSAD